MANNVRKLLQVSEEAAPLLQVPIMVGNEMFVLTQQDVRRTEDIRYLSYDRIIPNGHLFPTAAAAPAAAPVNYFGGICTPLALPYTTPPNCTLQELFGAKKEAYKPPVADVSTQLAWSKLKEIESSSRTHFHLSSATSTSNLTKSCGCQHEPPKSRSQHTSCHSQAARSACCQTETSPTKISTASNTDSPTILKAAASDMTVAESKSSVANASDVESKNNFNGYSASDVSTEESKRPSRHNKEQQTCTYTDIESHQHHSPREERRKQKKQQKEQQENRQQSGRQDQSNFPAQDHTPDYAQEPSRACQTDANIQDPTRWTHPQYQPRFYPQDQINAHPQDQYTPDPTRWTLFQPQDQLQSRSQSYTSRGIRCVHFAPPEEALSFGQNTNNEARKRKQL